MADEPKRIAALIHLIKNDLGYQLHRSVQALKIQLSTSDVGTFHFRDGALDIDASVTRPEFESWIVDELQQIETCVEGSCRARTSTLTASTPCFSPAAPRSCQRSGGSSNHASAPRASVPARSSRQSSAGYRCK